MLGRIIRADSQLMYVCQIYMPGEIDSPPARDDFAFGQFVAAELDQGRQLVALVADTVRRDPAYARFSPRLFTPEDARVLAPDLLDEKLVAVSLVAVGILTATGPRQGVPALSADTGAAVTRLKAEAVTGFHADADGRCHVDYMTQILEQNLPLARPLLLAVLAQLRALFPAQTGSFELTARDLQARALPVPLGDGTLIPPVL